MSTTDVFYFEGLDDILIALMATPDNVTTEPTYGEIHRIPIATKIGIKGNGSTLEKWASSKMFRRVSRETKHEISLDHVGLPTDLWDMLKGDVANKGVVFGKSEGKEYPYFAFGFIGRTEGGGRKAVWYPKCQISNVVDESYETGTEETKIDDVSTNIVAIGLNYNNVMHAAFDSYRDSAVGVDLSKFIQQVVYDEGQWENLTKITPPETRKAGGK